MCSVKIYWQNLSILLRNDIYIRVSAIRVNDNVLLSHATYLRHSAYYHYIVHYFIFLSLRLFLHFSKTYISLLLERFCDRIYPYPGF